MSTNQQQQLSDRAKGNRQKIRRNRKIKYPQNSVVTDGKGNILERPFTKHLDCFADPVEWQWGQYDRPRVWGNNPPEPNRCALCPITVFCAQVSWERIQSSPPLIVLHHAWELATSQMPTKDKFLHATWAKFVTFCESCDWSDINDVKLEQDNEKRWHQKLAKARKNSSKRRKLKKRLPRAVPKRMINAISDYRDARVAEMLMLKLKPQSPLSIRNRTPERLTLIADAWQGRELLERGCRKASASAVLNWLKQNGRIEPNPPVSMVKRVNEALVRADQFISDGVWPDFDPGGTSLGATGMHPSAVTILLDDDVDGSIFSRNGP